jgi:hypothetical protein
MNWYRVRLNGQNFLLNIQGEPRKYGFYTTRDVEADSFEKAEMKAIELVKGDGFLKNSTLNNKEDSPMIYVEDMKILEPYEEQLKNDGYTFYTDDEAS